MEHILQFAINIDDDTIKKQVESSATQQVVNELVHDIKPKIINSWGNLTLATESIIKRTLEDSKDEIIEKAAELVADSMKRSKKYREALAKVVEEVEE